MELILICAQAEYRALHSLFPDCPQTSTPFGQCFQVDSRLYLHTGWGKAASAAASSWAMTEYRPQLVVNLGTCGGFAGAVQEGDLIYVRHTLFYDIIERMGDPREAINHFACELGPMPEVLAAFMKEGRIISADQDLDASFIHSLRQDYDALGADWESASIAWVCKKLKVPCHILRGVSDVVSHEKGSPAYANIAYFQKACLDLMCRLHDCLNHLLASGD